MTTERPTPRPPAPPPLAPADDDAAGGLNIHFQHLLYLRELLHHDTLTAAAARLHVSQPALSQALTEMERRLGVALVERDGRRRRLTQAGQRCARFAEETLGHAAELQRWLRAYRGGAAGTLRVGMIDAASLYFLPGTIRRFRASHPQVQLRLVVADSAALLEQLARFELDLAFVVGPANGDTDGAAEVERTIVAAEPLYLYAPAGVTQSPAEGAWVLYPAGSRTRTLIDEGLARLGIEPRTMLESANPEILRQMVRLGLGWSVLPAAVAEDGDGTATLVPHRAQPVAERTLVGMVRRHAPPDERVAQFLALARQMPRA